MSRLPDVGPGRSIGPAGHGEEELGARLVERRGREVVPGHGHDVEPVGKVRLGAAENLAKEALDPVSVMGLSDLPTDRDAEPEMGGSASCVRSRAGSAVASEDPAQGCSRLWARVHTVFKLVRPGHGAKVVLRWRISMADQVR